jgi:opacity protein-like surface antigen
VKKPLSVTIVAATFCGAPAFAADMPAPAYKAAPPMVTPIYNWSGPYIGIEGGWGGGHSDQSDPGIPSGGGGGGDGDGGAIADGRYSVRGGLVGGTWGYNWQAGPWVFGLEGDYSWADIQGSSGICGLSSGLPHGCGTRLDSLGTFRGRLGYAVGPTDNWLLYATGGLAVGEVHAFDNLSPASGSDFRTGWTVGGGVEFALARNWSAKVEYLYVDLGSAHLFDVVPGVPETVSFKTNIIRAGVNYKFDWNVPFLGR